MTEPSTDPFSKDQSLTSLFLVLLFELHRISYPLIRRFCIDFNIYFKISPKIKRWKGFIPVKHNTTLFIFSKINKIISTWYFLVPPLRSRFVYRLLRYSSDELTLTVTYKYECIMNRHLTLPIRDIRFNLKFFTRVVYKV